MVPVFILIILAVAIIFPSAIYLWSGVLLQSILLFFLMISVGSSQRKYKLFWSNPITIAFVIYGLFSFFSILTAYYFNASWHGWFTLVFGFLTYWLVATASSPKRRLYRFNQRNLLACGIIVIGVIEAGYGIYQYVYGFNYSIRLLTLQPELVSSQYYSGIMHALQTHRIIGTFGNPNIYALLLSITLPVSLFYFLSDINKKIKIILLFVGAIILSALALTYSRGGTLAAIIGLIPITILFTREIHLEIRKQVDWIIALVVVTALAILFIAKTPQSEIKLEKFAARFTTPTSTVNERVQYWKIARRMIADHPIIGTGIGSYGIRYGRYKPVGIGETKYVHNLFLQVWVEQGLFGFVSWSGLLVILIYIAIRRMRQSPGQKQVGLETAVFGSILAFIVDGFFGYGYYFPELYYLFCFLLGLFVSCVRKDSMQTVGEGQESSSEKPRSIFQLLAYGIWVLVLSIIWYYTIYTSYLGQLYFNGARNQLEIKQLIPAAVGYRAALVCEPSNSEYHQHLGNTLLQLNQVQEGIKQLELATRLNLYTAYYHSDLAEAYRSVGRINDAEEECKQAIMNYPNKPAYHFQLAQIYAQQANDELAIKEMQIFKELSK